MTRGDGGDGGDSRAGDGPRVAAGRVTPTTAVRVTLGDWLACWGSAARVTGSSGARRWCLSAITWCVVALRFDCDGGSDAGLGHGDFERCYGGNGCCGFSWHADAWHTLRDMELSCLFALCCLGSHCLQTR